MRTLRTQPHRSSGKVILFSVCLVVLFFGALEATLRGWVYLIRDPSERFDTTTGTFVLVPGNHARVRARPFQVNTRGFVGPEFEDPVPPGTIRIVALGDSCTFGAGTELETYPGQLALRLNGAPDSHRYQVINAGIRGLNTGTGLASSRHKGLTAVADIVTVYLGWNDLMKFEPGGQVEHPGVRILVVASTSCGWLRACGSLLFFIFDRS